MNASDSNKTILSDNGDYRANQNILRSCAKQNLVGKLVKA